MKPSTDRIIHRPPRPRQRITLRMLIASLLAVTIGVSMTGGVVSASPQMCVAAAESLNDAKAEFAANCEGPRIDCDKIDGMWFCSNRIIGSAAPGGLTSDDPFMPTPPSEMPETPAPDPTVPADPTDPPAPPPAPTEQACVASATSLGQAKTSYAATCSAPRVDCDKIDGLWTCSSEVIGDAAPGIAPDSEPPAPTPQPPAPTPQPPAPTPTPQPPAPTPQPPAPTPEPTPDLPEGVHPDIIEVIDVNGRNPGGIGWADSYSVGDQCYCATTFDHNIGGIQVETPNGTRTVRQVCGDIGPGPGIDGRPIYNDIQCGNGPANDAGDEDDCPGRVDIGREGCGHIGPRWNFDGIN